MTDPTKDEAIRWWQRCDPRLRAQLINTLIRYEDRGIDMTLSRTYHAARVILQSIANGEHTNE